VNVVGTIIFVTAVGLVAISTFFQYRARRNDEREIARARAELARHGQGGAPAPSA
jgi:hypothetical protein